MPKFEDLTGQKFNRLLVLSRAPTRKHRTMWLCKCDCGKESTVGAAQLKSGTTKSCGCWKSEVVIEFNKATKTIHGSEHTRPCSIHRDMKTRCLNKNSKDYMNYGGRGITICDDWIEFINFQKWALDNGYDDSLTLDRIDVNGNYEPSNCRWVTTKEQNNNRRDNRLLTIGEMTKTVTLWAEEKGIGLSTLIYRLNAEWPIDKLFIHGKRRKVCS